MQGQAHHFFFSFYFLVVVKQAGPAQSMPSIGEHTGSKKEEDATGAEEGEIGQWHESEEVPAHAHLNVAEHQDVPQPVESGWG